MKEKETNKGGVTTGAAFSLFLSLYRQINNTKIDRVQNVNCFEFLYRIGTFHLFRCVFFSLVSTQSFECFVRFLYVDSFENRVKYAWNRIRHFILCHHFDNMMKSISMLSIWMLSFRNVYLFKLRALSFIAHIAVPLNFFS